MIVLPKQATFVPAVSTAETRWKEKDFIFKGKDSKFFTPESVFQYPYLLTTVPYEIDKQTPDFREAYGYPKEYCLIADSGGFQIAKAQLGGQDIGITPLQILRWMENNADIGMNLDSPPWTNFDKSLKTSQENFTVFQNNRENYDFKLYNVLHGKTLPEMIKWYSGVKDYEFDGWAFGARPADNIYLQIIGYMFLRENNAAHWETNFHLFGVSGIKNMLVLAMLSHEFGGSMTFDSSSYITGMRYRRFYFPKDIRYGIEFGRDAKKTMQSIPCRCPVCRRLEIDDLYSQESPGAYVSLLLHDLYQYIEVNRMINNMVSDDIVFMEYAKSVGEEKTVRIARIIIDQIQKKGVSHVYDNFRHSMVLRDMSNPGNNMMSFISSGEIV